MQADVNCCPSCSLSLQNVGCRLELVTISGNNANRCPRRMTSLRLTCEHRVSVNTVKLLSYCCSVYSTYRIQKDARGKAVIKIKMTVPFICSYESNSVGSWSLCSVWFSLEKGIKPRLFRAPLGLVHVLLAPGQLTGDVCTEVYVFPLPSSLGTRDILNIETGRIDCFLFGAHSWVVAVLSASQKLCNKF